MFRLIYCAIIVILNCTTLSCGDLITLNEVNVYDDGEFVFRLHDKYLQSSKAFESEAWNALNALNATLRRFIEFQQRDVFESRDAMMHSRLGVFLFTRYCGPGSRILNKIFQTDERTYANVDYCCRMHDECPHYVETSLDYQQYPGLEVRPQFFSRWFFFFVFFFVLSKFILI